ISGGQSGSTEAKFSLYPEHLGHIEIKITSQQGQIAAQIITDTSMAKDALEGQLQQLRQALQQHGLLVQKLDIVQQIPVSLDWNQGNLSFSQGGSHSSYEQKSSHLAEDEANNQEETDQQEIEIETASISYGGAMPKKATNIDFTA
ncbi:MAG TPA: flagellar hook-length control protein FliK, partial [Neobacillus sp.]